MNEQPDTKRGLFAGLGLRDIVVIGTAIAAVIGQWFVMGAEIKDLRGDVTDMRVMLAAYNVSLFEARRDIAVLNERVTNLNNLVIELRRRASLETNE